MAERHTSAGVNSVKVTTLGGGGRSPFSRGADGLPFRPYVYRGGDREPEAVIRARERHQALDEEIGRRRALAEAVSETAWPDVDDIGYGWRRELLDDG